ncbi:DUF202 domain-containing protein [Franconibacter pulveris 1160]|jgi:hypothetical protein|uniref:Membrane protein n=1 Tax=Franconibacter pulveris TaxID=435910 RepID=A0A0J8VQN4_9ENTR|nr:MULTISPECIES: DUF202 domain-containing protein [Franconibacter]KMV35491.1 membrane protein [Franconibacter pulveris]MCK1970656.1 DUF202 domain-containing protein [Franconibacter sp. IITDAS19]MEB5924347.1 DUF202 domain-containing protein [Franconibacter daqui]GGD36788.1 inner membrane protein YidG [Franconibacter daqui]
MADSRRARRIADPGLQPERTSLAWFRTFLGYGALLMLALRHSWQQAGMLFWAAIAAGFIVAGVLYGYARQRNVMDTARSDFLTPAAAHAKLLIALAVCMLALLFAVVHLGQLVMLISGA